MPAVPRGLRARANKILLLVLDVDGVLTDGRLYYGGRGESLKVFHVQDGHGIKQLQHAGVEVAIVSGRRSAAVARRARELGIKCVHQGVADKSSLVSRLVKDRRLSLAQCGCVGDDSPDVPVMRAAGLAIAVANAHADALAAAHYVTTCRGGHGAVREVCDLLLALRATTR